MALEPNRAGDRAEIDSSGEEMDPGASGHHWFNKLAAVLYAFFCLEIGILLLLLPWVGLWDHNYFALVATRWPDVWSSPYLRGAVSGLGVVDIAIALIELVRLRRFARRRDPGTEE